jgi:chromosome segregation ATPase
MNIDERLEKLTGSVEMLVADGQRIDKRIDRLTERHEALAQSVEILVADSKLATQRIQILAVAVDQMLSAIRSHEKRISGLEGGT